MMINELEALVVSLSTKVYIVVIGFEILFSFWFDRRYYTLADTATNVYLTLLNMLLDIGMRSLVVIVLGFFYHYRFFNWEAGWTYWLILFLAEDFLFYWLHWVDHHSRLFWAVHVTHHSSAYFNLTTGFRSSVFQPVYRFIYFIPLALLGFPPLDIFLMYSVTQIYGILLHTQTVGKLNRFVEFFLVTPSHHRVHHASDIPYLDKNMGMVLIIWDRMFGTFAEEQTDKPMRYGLFQKETPKNPVSIVFHEWQSLWKDLQRPLPFATKIKYLLKPPGWSHDGSTLTSKELRDQVNAPLASSDSSARRVYSLEEGE